MKTEELKQNVKGYVHQFEDGGLRLLRKGQKGVIHAIFSRFGLVLILLLLQVGLLFSIFRWFGNLWPHYFGGSVVVTSAMVIYLLNSKMDNSAKITWMVVVAILPVVGVPVKSRALNGLDSLLSIVQMPAGVPVATVAINGAKNAALIAVSILALSDGEVAARLDAFRARQTADVLKAEL